jgi:hypothetical protein
MIGQSAGRLHLYLPDLAKPTAVYRATMQISIASIYRKTKNGSLGRGSLFARRDFAGTVSLPAGSVTISAY